MSFVLSQLEHGVLTLTLNLPTKLNPISFELQSELREVLVRVHTDTSIRCVILTGAGKAFCVGADLSSLQGPSKGISIGDSAADWMQTVSNPLVLELRGLPVPLVCAINGPAAGAGVGLALCGDVVIASRDAYFYLPFLPKLGIVPDLGCTWALPRLAGSARAMGMALLNERLSAERAVQWGLIWDCFDATVLMSQATDLARRLAQLPPNAVAEARAAFKSGLANSLESQLHYESERQRELMNLPAFAEGVNAFLQKRSPVFNTR